MVLNSSDLTTLLAVVADMEVVVAGRDPSTGLRMVRLSVVQDGDVQDVGGEVRMPGVVGWCVVLREPQDDIF